VIFRVAPALAPPDDYGPGLVKKPFPLPFGEPDPAPRRFRRQPPEETMPAPTGPQTDKDRRPAEPRDLRGGQSPRPDDLGQEGAKSSVKRKVTGGSEPQDRGP